MDACPEDMEAAPCSLTYDLKRFFKQQGKVFLLPFYVTKLGTIDLCREGFLLLPFNN